MGKAEHESSKVKRGAACCWHPLMVTAGKLQLEIILKKDFRAQRVVWVN